jgi:hypothetical protein
MHPSLLCRDADAAVAPRAFCGVCAMGAGTGAARDQPIAVITPIIATTKMLTTMIVATMPAFLS